MCVRRPMCGRLDDDLDIQQSEVLRGHAARSGKAHGQKSGPQHIADPTWSLRSLARRLSPARGHHFTALVDAESDDAARALANNVDLLAGMITPGGREVQITEDKVSATSAVDTATGSVFIAVHDAACLMLSDAPTMSGERDEAPIDPAFQSDPVEAVANFDRAAHGRGRLVSAVGTAT